MMLRITLGILAALAVISSSLADEKKPVDPDLARQGFAFVLTYCGKCHGKGASEGGGEMDVTDPAELVDYGYLVPDDPESSEMWRRVVEGEMPPEGEPQPAARDAEIFRRWIAAGAPKPVYFPMQKRLKMRSRTSSV
ncbi:MAG: hypothetical protein KY475_00360 [Planctomycetes bacterium]|nr:hypothetical protein [Planctomycetota bacterium]